MRNGGVLLNCGGGGIGYAVCAPRAAVIPLAGLNL